MSSGQQLETVRAEDFIEYFLFPPINTTFINADSNTIDQFISQINQIAENYCNNYIWHKDPFRVIARSWNSNLLIENQTDDQDDVPPCIYGITHFGDNIQDEWFIVSLLFELTRQIPGLMARCCDSDGEFMLIEAADFLPKWANPETCSGNLFIFKGELHLIDITQTKKNLSIAEAVNMLRTNPNLHKVPQEIDQCIRDRISQYPDRISKSLHRTTVYLPMSAAALLRFNPGFIAAAVHAFYQRDPIDMKVCRAMKHFPPENRVYTSVTFTNCLYAMLMHSNFQPDRRIGWNLPPVGDPKYKAHLLGVKIACGFEILASQAKPLEQMENTKAWKRYHDSLKNRGYFQEFLENSNDYMRLLNEAKEYFKINVASISIAEEFGTKILETLKSLDCSTDEFKDMETILPPDDDDSWLNISPEELDKMLQTRYGIQKTFNGDEAAAEFSENLNQFLEKKSDFSGIEIDDDTESIPIAPKRGIKKLQNKVQIIDPTDSGSGTDSPAAGTNIEFNPDAFQNHVQEMLDLVIPEDNWESNSDMSDFADEDGLGRNIDDMTGADANQIKTSLNEYMNQMDRELARTTIGKSFEKVKNDKLHADMDSFDDIEDFTPVDIDVNALTNMVDSYQHQLGGPGPATSLLNSMGIRVKASRCVDDLNVPNT